MLLFALLLATDLSTLLDRATAAHEKARPLYEGEWSATMTVLAEELDKKGNATSTTEIERKGDELVRYVENGKDVTAEKKAKGGKLDDDDDDDDDDEDSFGDPFASKTRDQYSFELLREENGLATIAFKPKGKKALELGIGEAVIESETGALRKLTFRPSDLPPMVQRVDIQIACDETTPLGYAMSAMRVEGEAGALFLKKRFRMTSTFKEWTKK